MFGTAPGRDFCLIYADFVQKRPLQNPVAAKIRPKSTKWRHNGLRTVSPELPKFGLGFLMDFGRALAHFWHQLDSNEHQNATQNQHLAPKCEQKQKP